MKSGMYRFDLSYVNMELSGASKYVFMQIQSPHSTTIGDVLEMLYKNEELQKKMKNIDRTDGKNVVEYKDGSYEIGLFYFDEKTGDMKRCSPLWLLSKEC